jgi:hypothetical protein
MRRLYRWGILGLFGLSVILSGCASYPSPLVTPPAAKGMY